MNKQISVIFDCDGTLLKSLGLGMEAYNVALKKVGARPHGPEEIKRYFGRSADKIFLELLKDDAKATLAYEYYIEIERSQVSRIIPHDGIVDLLSSLKSHHVRMGVVTGRHSRELEFLLNENNITSYFQSFICDNQIENSKPAPDGLLKACDELKISPENSFYVGDSVMDMQAANRAGARGIAALWDEWAVEELMKKESPHFLSNKPEDILQTLKLLCLI